MFKQIVVDREIINGEYEEFARFVVRVTEKLNELENKHPHVNYVNENTAIIIYKE